MPWQARARDQAGGAERGPDRLRGQARRAQPGARAVSGRRTRRHGAGRQGRSRHAHLLGRGPPRLQDALVARLTALPDHGRDVPVPFEAVGFLSPAEHGSPRARGCRHDGAAWVARG